MNRSSDISICGPHTRLNKTMFLLESPDRESITVQSKEIANGDETEANHVLTVGGLYDSFIPMATSRIITRSGSRICLDGTADAPVLQLPDEIEEIEDCLDYVF